MARHARQYFTGGDEGAVGGAVLPVGAGPRVTLRTTIGGERVLELPYGEDLPA